MRKACIIIFMFILQGCNPKQASNPFGAKQLKIAINNGIVATVEGYTRLVENEKRLQLPHLLISKDSLRLRYMNDRGQVVDIWTMDYKVFYGCVTNFADTLNMEHGWESPRTFISKNSLDTVAARLAYNIIKPICGIPDCSSIKGWGSGFDGVTHVFEISTPVFYTYNTYWTPQVIADSIWEAREVSGIIASLDSVLGLKAMFARFYDRLPPGRYTVCPSYLCTIMKPTKDEVKDNNINLQRQRAADLKRQRPYLK